MNDAISGPDADASSGVGRARRASTWQPDHTDLMILGNLSEGRTIEYVARRLDLSERTVRRRLRTIADEIGVDSTMQAVVHAVRRGLI